MGHTKTNWEKRALAAEAKLLEIGMEALRMERIVASWLREEELWRETDKERQRYREALEWIAGKENHAAGLEINSRLCAMNALRNIEA